MSHVCASTIKLTCAFIARCCNQYTLIKISCAMSNLFCWTKHYCPAKALDNMWNLDDPNQSVQLCLIAQSEDWTKTAEPGHKKSTTTNVCSVFFLAYLSRRLGGELLVYQWFRRPSGVRQHFQTSSSLKPLGQLNSNFIWRLLRMGERKFVKMVLVTWPRWPPCPYMVKTI